MIRFALFRNDIVEATSGNVIQLASPRLSGNWAFAELVTRFPVKFLPKRSRDRMGPIGEKCMLKLRLSKLLQLAIAVFPVLISGTASAMEWRLVTNPYEKFLSGDSTRRVIRATGTIDAQDAQRFEALLKATADADPRRGRRPLIVLDSTGGNLKGGIMLGAAIRDAWVDTHVEEKAVCGSACTYAFIGGIERSVLGKFAIHAAKMDKASDNDGDDYQLASALMMIYTRELIGRDDMASEALKFGSNGFALVNDSQLRDWNIITVAARPSQAIDPLQYKTLSCPQPVVNSAVVSHLVCGSIALGRLDTRMSLALEALANESLFPTIRNEQARWAAYRDACQRRGSDGDLDRAEAQASTAPADLNWSHFLLAAVEPRGRIAIERCLDQAYNDRVSELEALMTYFKVGRQADVQKGWKAPQ